MFSHISEAAEAIGEGPRSLAGPKKKLASKTQVFKNSSETRPSSGLRGHMRPSEDTFLGFWNMQRPLVKVSGR